MSGTLSKARLASAEQNGPVVRDRRRRLVRGACVVAGLALVGGVAWLAVERRGDANAGSNVDSAAAVPAADLTEFDGDPGDAGDMTDVAAVGDPPPEAAELCEDGTVRTDAEGQPDCRITTSLKNPPARSESNAAEVLKPIAVRRPGSLGQYAIHDAADPTVLVDGQTYYVFSTSAQWLRVPVATIAAADLVPNGASSFSVRSPKPVPQPSFEELLEAHLSGTTIVPSTTVPAQGVSQDASTTDATAVVRTEAMPERAAWAREDGIWAPTVAPFGSRYVMFFAAKRPNPPDAANQECIGRAVSTHPAGPYVPDPTPVTCGLNGVHGALDPSVFRDRTTGRAYLLAAFGGTSTPLWSIPLTGDGLAAGGAVPLLTMQQPWETWFLENPSMIFNGVDYTLAYSAGRWQESSYSTGVARCRTPMGPCASQPSGPWLSTAGTVSGPGGLDFFTGIDGGLMAVHHGYETGREAAFGARHTFIRRAHADADSVTFP